MLTYVLLLALEGLLIGALARLALPGRDPMGVFATMAIGLAGAFVGGLVTYAFGGRGGAPFLIAFAVAFGIVYLIRRRRGGDLARPAGDAGPGRP